MGLCFLKQTTLAAIAALVTLTARAQENREELKLTTTSWQFEDTKIEVLLPPPSSFPFEISQQRSSLLPQIDVLSRRLQATIASPDIADPIVIRLKTTDIRKLVRQLGNPKAQSALTVPSLSVIYFEKLNEQIRPRIKDMRLTLAAEDLGWLDLAKLAKTLSTPTTNPFLKKELWEEAHDEPRLAKEMKQHFGSRARVISRNIERWLETNSESEGIPLQEMLPHHLQNSLGQFFAFRGRNCFATALSFADNHIIGRPQINVVKEAQHDKGMINADEFQQALWLGYYELDAPEVVGGLQLGDLVVFYDDAEEAGYRSYRHAAIHVADTTYFHKQSKSATSPIEFVDWTKLVSTWSSLTKKLDYKVYRKLPIGVARYQSPGKALEKIFWSE